LARVQERYLAALAGKMQVDIGVRHRVFRLPAADLQIARLRAAAVDQMVAVGRAGGEAGGFPCRQSLVAGVGHQSKLARQDIDELVLMAVPVALGGGRARRQTHEIHAEVGQADRIPQALLCAVGAGRLEGLGIARTSPDRHFGGIQRG
jgi:hypothetical protein